jgi:YggT family protein
MVPFLTTISVATSIYGFLRFYQTTLIIRVYLAWFPSLNLYSQPFFALVRLTNPYLRFWRGLMPAIGPIDLSPLMGFLALGFAEDFCASLAEM